MKKVEALPYSIEEGIKKIAAILNREGIKYNLLGREIYINEDFILNEASEIKNKSILERIKNYMRNEKKENYIILSFDSAPKGSYLVIEYSDYHSYSTLAKVLSFKQGDYVGQITEMEIKDKKLEKELKIIHKELMGIDYKIEEDEPYEDDEYEFIEYGERNCKLCGTILRRITISDKDNKINDGYKCTNTNCLKIYIIR